jgi:hypothetical protein
MELFVKREGGRPDGRVLSKLEIGVNCRNSEIVIGYTEPLAGQENVTAWTGEPVVITEPFLAILFEYLDWKASNIKGGKFKVPFVLNDGRVQGELAYKTNDIPMTHTEVSLNGFGER